MKAGVLALQGAFREHREVLDALGVDAVEVRLPQQLAGLDASSLPAVIRYDGQVTIDPSLVGEDKDMLEDLVMAAMNDAVAKAEATTQAKMAGFAQGLNLPPGMSLPF